MNKNKRTLLPCLAIFLLVVQMMNPIPVFADGEPPPETPATEESPPPEETAETTEENPVEEPTSTDEEEIPEDSMVESGLPSDDSEEAVAAETPQPDESEETETSPVDETDLLEESSVTEETPESESTSEPASAPEETQPEEAESPDEVPTEGGDLTVAEVLEQAPPETEIVVVNEQGQVEPLVTEEAAEIAANADPIWCPDGITPQDSSGGCSPSFTSATALSDLITWLQKKEQHENGTIWIEKGYDSASEGVDTFVLNGNWFSDFQTHTLTIQGGWNGLGTTTVDNSDPSTFTGDRIRIVNWKNDVTLNNILIDGAFGEGLAITTTGDINLNYVSSQNNHNTKSQPGRGARLNNEGGTGNVTVKNSSFNKNEDTGLRVVSSGNITLADVIAEQNGWRGAALDNSSGDGTVLVNSGKFNENTTIGLVVFSSGDVGGDKLTVNHNWFMGMEIYTDGGNVTLTDITANQNIDDGIYARIWEGTLTIMDSTLGGGLATGNGDEGLDAIVEGNVTLKNVTAIGNFENGAKVYAGFYDGEGGPVPSGPGDLTVSDSTFSQNVDTGFRGYTDTGKINFSNVFANQNGEHGLDLTSNEGAINLTNAFANQNDWFGLWLEAYEGDITLDNLTANMNGLGGAVLQAEDGNINVLTGQYNSNGADAIPDCEDGLCEYGPPIGGIGLAAGSWGGTGQIYLDNVQASENYGDGAWLTGDDVVVRNSTFENNGQGLPYLGGDDLWADGLYIEDLGGSSAYVECVQANNNAAYGIEIITGDIILNGATAFGNGWDNFYFESDTLATLENPCSDSEKESHNTTPSIPWKTVQVTGGESIGLSCSTYTGTILVLPNGDEIRLPCPTIGEGKLSPLADDSHPGDLPAGNDYVSALTADVIKGGVNLEILPASMIVSFLPPEDMLDADLTILYWNGTEWVEVPGAYKTADGRFEVAVNYTGDFMLVSK